jgi:hypothetical protein
MHKSKSFCPWQPEQTSLLPPSLSDWLSEDHQVYFPLDLVDELDLSAILIPAQNKDPRGEKGFDSRMMTLLLLYAYCVGIVSTLCADNEVGWETDRLHGGPSFELGAVGAALAHR